MRLSRRNSPREASSGLPNRIRATAVCPGAVYTELLHRGRPERTDEWRAEIQPWPDRGDATAIADVAMGFVFVTGSLQPIAGFLCLAVASCLLYTAGMILNDVYDFDVDMKERPSRPLPSGRISRRRAQSLGYGMLATGVLLALCVSLFAAVQPPLIWRAGVPRNWRSGTDARVSPPASWCCRPLSSWQLETATKAKGLFARSFDGGARTSPADRMRGRYSPTRATTAPGP